MGEAAEWNEPAGAPSRWLDLGGSGEQWRLMDRREVLGPGGRKEGAGQVSWYPRPVREGPGGTPRIGTFSEQLRAVGPRAPSCPPPRPHGVGGSLLISLASFHFYIYIESRDVAF